MPRAINTHPPLLLLMIMLAACLSPARVLAFEGPKPTFVQGMVGAAKFSEDDLTFSETASDGATTSENDLSSMPYVGLAFQYPFQGEKTQVGLDSSLLFGWRAKNRTVRAGNSQLYIKVDSSLWFADLSVGLFLKHTFAERWRVYLAAGPALLFGDYSGDTDEEDPQTSTSTENSHSASEFGVGGYVRGGFDFRFDRNAYVGICVRGLKTDLEFDDAPDASSNLGGVQYFVTFSRHF